MLNLSVVSPDTHLPFTYPTDNGPGLAVVLMEYQRRPGAANYVQDVARDWSLCPAITKQPVLCKCSSLSAARVHKSFFSFLFFLPTVQMSNIYKK